MLEGPMSIARQSCSFQPKIARSARAGFMIILAICLSLQWMGCTVIGFTAGAIQDATRCDFDTVGVLRVKELSRGDSVFVAHIDGDTTAGVYLGTDQSVTRQYESVYRVCRQKDSSTVWLPSLNESVTLLHSSPLRGDIEGILVGFDPGVVCLKVDADTDRVSVQEVSKMLCGGGRTILRDTLKAWFSSRRVPLVSALLVNTRPGDVRIPLNEVQAMWKRNSKNSKWTALAFGAAADVLILVGLSISLSDGFMGGH